MTLSNIFFGKKVVQQAYLNNALIYQSKGWETLPSTCSEVWTKEYGVLNSSNVNQCESDSNNNIYVLADSKIFKIDSEGTLIWSKSINGIKYIAIDYNNDVYIALVDGDYSYVAKLDNKGNIENKFKANDYLGNKITNFALDNNYIYISTNYNDDSNFKIFKLDKIGNLIKRGDFKPNKSTLAVDDSFLYAGSRKSLIKLDKNKISSSPAAIDSVSINFNVENVILDGLGNIIFSYNNGSIFKYNIEAKTTTQYNLFTSSLNFSLALDYQKNLYSIYTDTIGSYKLYLQKFSSDGTLIFKTQILGGNSSAIVYGALNVDNNGNIYYLYLENNNNSTFTLKSKKFINLVKKGN